jgi:hypothetical protein
MKRHQARALLDAAEAKRDELREAAARPEPAAQESAEPAETVLVQEVMPGPEPADREAGEPAAISPDPRPDLVEDSAIWVDLLTRAYLRDGEDARGLFQALHGLRCCGMRLTPVPGGAVALTRDAQTVLTAEEYAAVRERYLVPHAAALQGLLRRGAVTSGSRGI